MGATFIAFSASPCDIACDSLCCHSRDVCCDDCIYDGAYESFSDDAFHGAVAPAAPAQSSVSQYSSGLSRVSLGSRFPLHRGRKYELGTVVSAYLVAGPICLLTFMPLDGRPLLQYFGFLGYVKVNQTLQLAGMCFVSGLSRVVCGRQLSVTS